ncbi:MAG: 2-oxoacid:ferredoxin oxidoreductase subunit beta [Acidobacteriia bacterium]|nr:2-oxoacid:ferredoxin oxidoreductase subunit beta [Terriglobia bacterium]
MTTVNPNLPSKTNRLGLPMTEYKGLDSTLCAGCGHDGITSQIVKAFYEYGVEPHRVAKFSGIGCSSKTPAYFIGNSHGFNAVHGRMPAVATGAMLANRTLVGVGVSGDGDTASIGIGQFIHLLRRNIPLIYIIENNGVYGLTKGQFSATADVGSKLKNGIVNELPPIDCCVLAIELGCSYVARSFAGDPKQLVPLIKGAIAHKGTALLDVISPCVTFNNHEGSTKSFKYAKEHEEMLHEIGFVPYFEQIQADYPEGAVKEVELHDGSHIRLRKLDRDYDPSSKPQALQLIRKANELGELITGLLFYDREKKDFIDDLNMMDEPLATLPTSQVRPSREALAEINKEFS